VPVLLDDPAAEPGGLVHFKLDASVAGVRPLSVMAVFVPVADTPAPELRTPELFYNSQWVKNSAAVPTDADKVSVRVDGLTPGVYLMQSIVEYPD